MKGIKAVILPDVHIDDKGYHPVYEPVKRFVKDFRPDRIYLLGDFADCCALSAWDLSKRRKMEGKRHETEVNRVEKELEYLSKYTDEIVWIAGNHEYRVERYIDNNPEVEGLLEYQKLIDLDKYKCTWVEYDKLYKVGKLWMFHGRYVTMHHAKKTLNEVGGNVVYCHTHKPQRHSHKKETQRSISAWCLSCLCDRDPDYLKGKARSWMHGFALLYVASNGEFNLSPQDITNGRFYLHGKRYE